MLDEKWIKKVEKNITRKIKIDIDNNEFLEEIFGDYIDKDKQVLVCSIDNVKAKNWPVHPWKHDERFSRDQNNYFSVSLFRSTREGQWNRERKNVISTCCIVLDDYTVSSLIDKNKRKSLIDEEKEKTKIPFNRLPLKPTWIVRTSEGNTQVGYKLKTLVTDTELIDYIYWWLREHKLTDKGGYSNKLMRLPIGKNTKYHTNNSCFLVEWNPELTYEISEIMSAFKIERLKGENSLLPSFTNDTLEGNALIRPCPEKGFVFKKAMEKGLEPREIEKGKYECICPWSNNHTTTGKTAVFYTANKNFLKGAFSCLHDHCKDKKLKEFLNFLDLGEEYAYGKDLIQLETQEEWLLFDAF